MALDWGSLPEILLKVFSVLLIHSAVQVALLPMLERLTHENAPTSPCLSTHLQTISHLSCTFLVGERWFGPSAPYIKRFMHENTAWEWYECMWATHSPQCAALQQTPGVQRHLSSAVSPPAHCGRTCAHKCPSPPLSPASCEILTPHTYIPHRCSAPHGNWLCKSPPSHLLATSAVRNWKICNQISPRFAWTYNFESISFASL